jgi:hypothetical protein
VWNLVLKWLIKKAKPKISVEESLVNGTLGYSLLLRYITRFCCSAAMTLVSRFLLLSDYDGYVQATDSFQQIKNTFALPLVGHQFVSLFPIFHIYLAPFLLAAAIIHYIECCSVIIVRYIPLY